MTETAFSAWFRRQLRLRDWTQADFVRQAGFSSSTVSQWATGQRVPDPESSEKIAETLGVNRDDVLAIVGHREPDEPLSADDPRRELLTLVRMLKLTPDRISGLRHQMRGWIDDDRRNQERENR